MKKTVLSLLVAVMMLSLTAMNAFAAEADVFSMTLKDGKIYNGSKEVETYTAAGIENASALTVKKNESIGKDTVTFNGERAIAVKDFKNTYPELKNLTLEAYFTATEIPDRWVDVISMQNSGGCGMELESPADGKCDLVFYLNFNEGGANVSGGKIEFGKFYHVVCCFGEGKACVYVNGELTGSTDYSADWTYKYPTAGTPVDFIVGADIGSSTEIEHGLIGEIAVANIYVKTLSASEVKTAFNAATAAKVDPPATGSNFAVVLVIATAAVCGIAVVSRKKAR